MDVMEKTAEAVAENSEEVVDKAAEIISEADVDWNAVFAGGVGIGIVAGIALTKFALIPVASWAKAKLKNRPPKAKVVKFKPKKDEPPVEEKDETEEVDKKSDEETPEK